MKKSMLIAGLLLLLTADAQAMKFKNEANQIVQVSRIAVLAVSDPEVIKWRAEQEADLRTPKAKGLKGRFATSFGKGSGVIKRKYQPHPEVVAGRKPKFVDKLYVEDDKNMIAKFKAKLKELRVDGIYMPGKVDNELFEETDHSEYLLTHKFTSEWERAQAIKTLTGAEGYIVPEIWRVEDGKEGPYQSYNSSMLVGYYFYDQEGRLLAKDNYTYKVSRQIFTLGYGLQWTAGKFAEKLLQLEMK